MAEAWEKDMIWMKFVNLESRGATHLCSVNGRMFQLEDGKTYHVPRTVMNALNNAVITKYKIEGNMDDEKVMVPTEEPRFFATEVAAPEEKVRPSVKKEALAAAAESLKGKD